MRSCLLIAVLAAAAAPAQTVSVRFTPVEKSVIEERLSRCPRKQEERLEALRQLFQQAGCNGDSLRDQPVKGLKLPNLLCTLGQDSGNVIIIGAHYDSVKQFGTGAADNWSGASLLPSIFESIKEQSRRHTLIFIGFSGEERGLVGSRFYVKHLTPEEKSQIRAMVNLDTLGLSPTKVWVNGSDKRLAGMLVAVSQATKLPVAAMNVERVGTTDSQPFTEAKIPSLAIHSVTQQTLTILHGPRDKLDVIRRDDYYDTYRLMTTYLLYLDAALE